MGIHTPEHPEDLEDKVIDAEGREIGVDAISSVDIVFVSGSESE
jgi:hypothetical protein